MTLFWKSAVALTLVVLEAAAAASVTEKSALIATKLRSRSAAIVSRERLSTCDANYHTCEDCIAAGCVWCDSDKHCATYGSWYSCPGEAHECPTAPPLDQIVPDVLEKKEWELVQLAAAASTLAGIPINIKQVDLGVQLLADSGVMKGFEVRIWKPVDDSNSCFIAFRGTHLSGDGTQAALNNLWADINTSPYTDFGLPTTNGFTDAVDVVQSWLQKAIGEKYSSGECAPATTFITGHSLGGAMANIAANRDLAKYGGDRSKGGLITFGSPRPWRTLDCEPVLAKLPLRNYRFVRHVDPAGYTKVGSPYSGYDIVPQLAPSTLFDVSHCAVRAIELNQIFHKDGAEYSGQTLKPNDMSRNAPVDFYKKPDFIPPFLIKTLVEIFENWWYIHDSEQYYLIAKDLYDTAK